MRRGRARDWHGQEQVIPRLQKHRNAENVLM
jgi:hypothetical protein